VLRTENHPDSKAEGIVTDHSPEKYDFDVHIMFDDAIKSIKNSAENGPQEVVVHDYVNAMMGAIKNAASYVYALFRNWHSTISYLVFIKDCLRLYDTTRPFNY
jgi:hypothetical protein